MTYRSQLLLHRRDQRQCRTRRRLPIRATGRPTSGSGRTECCEHRIRRFGRSRQSGIMLEGKDSGARHQTGITIYGARRITTGRELALDHADQFGLARWRLE